MKVLMCHNAYRWPGGEDRVYADEARLLEAHGHEVVRFERDNHGVASMGGLELLRKTIWNRDTEAEITELVRRERPDVLHCHNTFPLISPSVYAAAQSSDVAVVQTLHNYRLICPGAQLMRDGRICEDCVGKIIAAPGVLHSCYRDSRAASTAVAAMLGYHRLKRTWTGQVDRYIALTDFARQKFIRGGLPEGRIAVKPNFVGQDPGTGEGEGGYAVFVGRLSEEKGVSVLLDAWRRLPADTSLKIVGDGPLADVVAASARDDARITWLGQQSSETVFSLMQDAAVLVMPSVWYEPFGLSVIEAFATGTPVIASRTGSLPDLVCENETGFLFEPGDADNLAQTVDRALAAPANLHRMRQAARLEYEQSYTAEANYARVTEIYRAAISASRARHRRADPVPAPTSPLIKSSSETK